MAKTEKRHIGDWGEQIAIGHLQKLGYKIINRNYLTRHGELDIIAWHKKPHHGQTLCFVEVKTRRYNDGAAERATGASKVRHLMHAARQYCLARSMNVDATPIQFEQVSVYGTPGEATTVTLYTIPV